MLSRALHSKYLKIKAQFCNLVEVKRDWKQKGRDEKGCKMDVDGRQHVDGLEKCSLVDVDQEKCSGVDIDNVYFKILK